MASSEEKKLSSGVNTKYTPRYQHLNEFTVRFLARVCSPLSTALGELLTIEVFLKTDETSLSMLEIN